MKNARGAGERRHKVSIMKRTTTVTNLESTATYTAEAVTRWAAIEPLTARELLIAQQSQIYSEATNKITFGWTASFDATAKDQIKFGTRIYEIVGSPTNVGEAKRQIEVMAVERT